MDREYVALTTPDLIQAVMGDPQATPAELALVDRLAGAIDEIDLLVAEISKLHAERTADVDA